MGIGYRAAHRIKILFGLCRDAENSSRHFWQKGKFTGIFSPEDHRWTVLHWYLHCFTASQLIATRQHIISSSVGGCTRSFTKISIQYNGVTLITKSDQIGIIMVVKKNINCWQLNPTQPNPFHRRKFQTQPNPTHGWTQPMAMSDNSSPKIWTARLWWFTNLKPKEKIRKEGSGSEIQHHKNNWNKKTY